MPSLYKELIYAYRKKGNPELADRYLKRMQTILNAMLYSGDGTCESPYVSFWVREDYTLLKYLNYTRTGRVDIGNCAGQLSDKISVMNLTTKEETTVCFNISMIFHKTMGKK
jgi:pentatricopeptide repeat protein